MSSNGRSATLVGVAEPIARFPDTSIPGRRVAREMTAIVERHGKPGMIVSDNGTEFTCNAMLAWCRDNNDLAGQRGPTVL